ncbi:Siroheme synthase [Candidatus Desulfarcum epimagneticum]|uniref:precorrin-2 dehydrogenase n=1 Tax=uncultured Desulfobacteraceae bacterium TaxID=218296 RepID=A0A484HEB8_9BACT|nr:Siroheme synthase [uncultured Desulfobacteraceae bacterium]
MKYYPIQLNVKDRRCLVVGGGSVGARKAATLLECGARVTVVSPDAREKIADMAQNHLLVLKKRPYRESDLNGVFLVMGATDHEDLNRKIHADASGRGILCNIADRPELCDFILPAIVKKGDLIISISTSGKSPAFARHLKEEMEKTVGDETAAFLELMGAVRKKLLSQAHEPEAHKPLFNRLISGGLPDMLRRNDIPAVNALLKEVLGEGYEWESLMTEP